MIYFVMASKMTTSGIFVTLLLATLADAGNFKTRKSNKNHKDVLFNATLNLRGSSSSNYEQGGLASNTRNNFMGLTSTKHNYFLLETHRDKPVRPSGCPPCPLLGKPGPFCVARMDLGFVVESSASVEKRTKGNFKRLLDFVEWTIRKFSISSTKTRVGLITYGLKTDVVFNFDSPQSKSSVIRSLRKASTQSITSSNTGFALSMAEYHLFRQQPSITGSRKEVPKVLVIITDGRATDSVTEPAFKIKQNGVRIYSLGVGNYFDIKELETMASRPVSENVFIGPFNKLKYIRDGLVRSVCYGVGGFLKKAGNKECLCKQGNKKPGYNFDNKDSTNDGAKE